METAPFSKISPTALNLSWFRSQSGIPYAAQIAAVTKAKEKVAELMGPEAVLPPMMDRLAGWAELRFRALDRAIVGHSDIVEIAAGFSQRGLIAAKKSSGIRYLATDLPGIYAERVSLMGLFGIPENLYIGTADASNRDDVLGAADLFPGTEQLVVINEGLLSYLTYAQKLEVAKNICALLKKTGGLWFTPDIHTKDEFARMAALSQTNMQRFDEKIGRSFLEGCFESLDEAEELMKRAGFSVTRGEQLDYVGSAGLHHRSSAREVRAMLEDQHLWCMRPN